MGRPHPKKNAHRAAARHPGGTPEGRIEDHAHGPFDDSTPNRRERNTIVWLLANSKSVRPENRRGGQQWLQTARQRIS